MKIESPASGADSVPSDPRASESVLRMIGGIPLEAVDQHLRAVDVRPSTWSDCLEAILSG